MAAERVKSVLDSGWKPERPNDVRSAFLEMYSGFDDWQKDPSSDLYQAVEAAFGNVGVHAPETAIEHARRLGAVQVQASNEWVSDLDVYAAKFVDFSPVQIGAAPAAGSAAAVAATDSTVVTTPWKYDVFISHASVDKVPFVRDLSDALIARGLSVWYDTHTLMIGDSIRERIDDGLKSSKHGIVVLSHAFFERSWPKLELDGLFVRQTTERTNVILPIWHGVTAVEVAQYSTILAGRFAGNSADGVGQIADELVAAIRRG